MGAVLLQSSCWWRVEVLGSPPRPLPASGFYSVQPPSYPSFLVCSHTCENRTAFPVSEGCHGQKLIQLFTVCFSY